MNNQSQETSLQDISIPLQICVGEVSVPIGTLLSMRAGKDFDFKFPSQDHVTILLAGEPIALASIVEQSDEAFIVRINSVIPPSKGDE